MRSTVAPGPPDAGANAPLPASPSATQGRGCALRLGPTPAPAANDTAPACYARCRRRGRSGSGMATRRTATRHQPRQSRADAALAVKRWGVLDGQGAARSPEGGSTADGMASVKLALTVFLRDEVARDDTNIPAFVGRKDRLRVQLSVNDLGLARTPAHPCGP